MERHPDRLDQGPNHSRLYRKPAPLTNLARGSRVKIIRFDQLLHEGLSQPLNLSPFDNAL